MIFSNLDILYEDNHIIVCKKKAGVPVQSARTSTPDMVSMLKNYLFKQSPDKKEPYLAVIHRLDQPVEGILVFAKTPFAAKELNRELQSGGFSKHYHARVQGKPPKDTDVLEDYMVKDSRTNTSCICEKGTPGAKLARLSYTVIPETSVPSEKETTTLLDILLDTGRHHQIRVQMAHMGCPIIGDKKYNAVASKTPEKLQLCAYKLTFHHPKTKKEMTYIFEE